MITRRAAGQVLAGALAAAAGSRAAVAQQARTIKVGINLSFTGADAESAKRISNGAVLAFEEANAHGGVGGYKVEVMMLDDGTATAGQYDPAQAAVNARRAAGDRGVMALVGPQMSGAGKAMAPILSAAGLATITPTSTNPDLTDPKFAQQFRPAGKAIYFRTVTTDAFQGPNMANFYADTLKVKSVYVLDDTGAYGVGLADAFQGQAEKRGIKVLGRDKLDPKAADYTAVLTKIKSLNAESLYYGGVGQAGVKLAKQSYDIIPQMPKGGGDGLYGPDILQGAGFPAAEGWYATIASPHVVEDPKLADWIKRYVDRFKTQPDDYSITAYTAAQVILDSIKRVAATGKPVTREAVRDAIQATRMDSLQGQITFDEHGDLRNRVISVFQIRKDGRFELNDVLHQYKYVGTAPMA